MNHANPDFSDLEDASFGITASGDVRQLSHEQLAEAAAPRYAANQAHRAAAADQSNAATGLHRETCRKCGGTGGFRGWSGRSLGKCFACDGKGYKLFKTSTAERAQNRAVKADRKIADMNANANAFRAREPKIQAWLDRGVARGFDFAISLGQGISKYGDLTPGQRAAVERCIAKDVERDAARAAAAAIPAPQVGEGVAPLKAALQTAKASGLKRVRLMTPQFTFALAKDTGKNPGCIYIKAGETYLGKITPEGRLQTSYDGRAQEAAIVEACRDPLAAAKLYGQETGRCSCCGRELTDPESIANSIGPICAKRFGW